MKILPFVILAKARIQTAFIPTLWIPAYAGMTVLPLDSIFVGIRRGRCITLIFHIMPSAKHAIVV